MGLRVLCVASERLLCLRETRLTTCRAKTRRFRNGTDTLALRVTKLKVSVAFTVHSTYTTRGCLWAVCGCRVLYASRSQGSQHGCPSLAVFKFPFRVIAHSTSCDLQDKRRHRASLSLLAHRLFRAPGRDRTPSPRSPTQGQSPRQPCPGLRSNRGSFRPTARCCCRRRQRSNNKASNFP